MILTDVARHLICKRILSLALLARSSSTAPTTSSTVQNNFARKTIYLFMVVALEQRKNMMSAFRFSNDNSSHLDESRIQIRALYPEHDEVELIPLYQKVAACLPRNLVLNRIFNRANRPNRICFP
eukprot:GHVP01042968.1.p1 GENE.GHVP01042968.1~~GHVP01042968.1.p1  ORF type:complete len:125 (+),score=10.34 GHVP01042968.1:593-967(+)